VFEHVTILLSFVYAIALTHLLSTTTELVLARKRVRFSGRYAAWMFNTVLLLLNNWIALWGLSGLKHWTVAEVAIQFSSAIVQYFTCSTFRVPEGGDDLIDLPALYQERRPIIFSAFLALALIAGFQNWWHRSYISPFGWIGEDLLIAPMGLAMALGGWARPRWLQWAAAVVFTGVMIYFFVANGIPVGS
jgi:hypothetical protein